MCYQKNVQLLFNTKIIYLQVLETAATTAVFMIFELANEEKDIVTIYVD